MSIYHHKCKNCHKNYIGQGFLFCSFQCYKTWIKNNGGNTKGIRYGTISQRFWPKVEINDLLDCWKWKGKKLNTGYGSFWLEGKMVLAHRISYYLTYGNIKNNLHVLHHCDNPDCVNPNHLFLGTDYDNIQDMIKKKRHQFGNRGSQSKLNETQVLEIIALLKIEQSCKSISELYNISRQTISGIKFNRTWKHIRR